jgi:hypothetical protein
MVKSAIKHRYNPRASCQDLSCSVANSPALQRRCHVRGLRTLVVVHQSITEHVH